MGIVYGDMTATVTASTVISASLATIKNIASYIFVTSSFASTIKGMRNAIASLTGSASSIFRLVGNTSVNNANILVTSSLSGSMGAGKAIIANISAIVSSHASISGNKYAASSITSSGGIFSKAVGSIIEKSVITSIISGQSIITGYE